MAVGEVGPDRALVWSRADRPSQMNLEVYGVGEAGSVETLRVEAAHDFTGKIPLRGLAPGTRYEYRVWFSDGPVNDRGQADQVRGAFRTAPDPAQPAQVRFAWGGDLGGQNVCRDRDEGFPILRTLLREPIDFFVALGDMIYADDLCREYGLYDNPQIPREVGRAADLRTFWEHWKYNRADASLQTLLARVAYLAVWDDHEVVNDFGPTQDLPFWGGSMLNVRLLPLGLRAFLDYNPIEESLETPGRLYRSLRFGQHLELFLLDTRQYREPSQRPDDPRHPKSMLGREQLTWLEARLAASDATWKVIVSSVPMALPTGSSPERGRDSWANYDDATGYEYELIEIVRWMRERGIRNSLWLTTDVHFAATYRHAPFPDDPGFRIHEVAVGPLSAQTFSNPYWDRTLATERLFYDPEGREAPRGWEEAKRFFNFGTVEISSGGSLTLRIINTPGERLYELTLRPS